MTKSLKAPDLFSSYISYIGPNESPTTFHRWGLISLVGALIGRSVYLPFGHSNIYPNQYILLTGSPAARKGTAIKICKNLIHAMRYANVAPNKAVKESFWKWMASREATAAIEDAEDMLDWDAEKLDIVNEAYVAHDEFIDFIGIGDNAFITNLANLWDNLPSFTQPKTRGKDITINKPTINILSGITPKGVTESFKALAHGGGFFSRVLFVFSEPTGIKITIPPAPDKQKGLVLVDRLLAIQEMEGEIVISPEVEATLDRIYQTAPPMEDARFEYYSQRRFTHLLKIIIILAVMRDSLEPSIEDCILANTILYNAELSMSSALGEYGKSKNADVAQGILIALNAQGAMTMRELWKKVRRDLGKFGDLREILDGLEVAEKVQKVAGEKEVLFLPNNQVSIKWDDDLIDFDLLLAEEHKR